MRYGVQENKIVFEKLESFFVGWNLMELKIDDLEEVYYKQCCFFCGKCFDLLGIYVLL